jgi:hypothetical protein
MSRRLNCFLLALALIAAPFALPGCGGGARTTVGTVDPDHDIKDIFRTYLTYYRMNNQKVPAKAADFSGKSLETEHSTAIALVKSGKFVVVWGTPMTSKDGGDPGTVLVYEKDALTNGGKVMMADGNLKTMSAADLSAAVKK